jgi:hypothetical protein
MALVASIALKIALLQACVALLIVGGAFLVRAFR